MVLRNIRDMLQSMGKKIKLFPLPKIDEQNDTTNNIPREITEETNIEVDTEDMDLPKRLNDDQKTTYKEILTSVDSDGGGIFFVAVREEQEKLFYIVHCSQQYVDKEK
jgi:hypothetical protein